MEKCENFGDFNPTKKRKVLIIIDDMIADMEGNKKLGTIVKNIFLRGRKLNIPLVFISKFYLKVPKTIRPNATHCFIMKISNKREFQQIAQNHSTANEFKN